MRIEIIALTQKPAPGQNRAFSPFEGSLSVLTLESLPDHGRRVSLGRSS